MSDRGRRLGERVKEILAEAVRTLKDPRVGFVTLTAVELSKDREAATVYYTVLPDDEATRATTAEGLASALPLLRRTVGAGLQVRRVPTLHFTPDPVPERSRRLEELLRDVRPPQGSASPGDSEDQQP